MDYVIVGMPAFLNMSAAWWVSHYDWLMKQLRSLTHSFVSHLAQIFIFLSGKLDWQVWFILGAFKIELHEQRNWIYLFYLLFINAYMSCVNFNIPSA